MVDGDTLNSRSPVLPWPAEWQHRASGWRWVNLCFIGVVAVGMGVGSGAALAAGNREQALFFGGVAVLCALIVVGGASFQRPRRRWRPQTSVERATRSGDQGILLPYSAGWFGWLVALLSVAGALAVGMLWWVSVEGLAGSRNMIGAMIGLFAAPYCGWFLLDMVRGRVVRGGLVLTPRGVHHRYLVVDDFVPWDSIFMVAPGHENVGPTIRFGVSPGRVQRRITSLVALRRASIPEPLPVYGRPLSVDPALAYYAVNFYWANRQARAELATGVGLERIRTGDLLGG